MNKTSIALAKLCPHHRRGGHIVFGADPVGVSVSIGMTLSCLHAISWTCGWILTKFAWMYNWDMMKSWLGFGDLDLIFKVTGGLNCQIYAKRCLCAPYLMNWLADFNQIYVPQQRGEGHTVFGVDPVGVGISVGMTLSCLHNISWTGGWILTKFAWM